MAMVYHFIERKVLSVSISQNIKQKRTERKLSQEYIAEQLGVSRQAVSKWETGQSEPTAKNLVELAQLLGVTVSELVEPEKISPAVASDEKMNWRLGFERFAIIAYSGAMILSTIETSDPVFSTFCAILAFITAVFMGIHILRLPSEMRFKTAITELCYCIVLYCMVTFLKPVIQNVFTSILILICCVVYIRYIRFRHIDAKK